MSATEGYRLHRHTLSIAGFTAVEMMIVLLVIGILATMTVPRVVGLMRHSAVRSAADDTLILWERAKTLAQRSQPDPDSPDRHFGVAIVQQRGQPTYAVLIRSAKAPADGDEIAPEDMLSAGVASGTAGRARVEFPPSVVVATATGHGNSPQVVDGTIAWYAQYGSGFPLSGRQVKLGKGATATPQPVGVDNGLLANLYQNPSLIRFQTVEFDPAVESTGLAFDFEVHQCGVATIEEQQQ